MVNAEIRGFLREQARGRFLRYVRANTKSDESSATHPSTSCQWDLLRMLEQECRDLGLADVNVGDAGYVYATLPARPGTACEPFGLLAHVDTSPEQPGDGVKPVLHKQWDGSAIRFEDAPDLALTPKDCPELAHFKGDTIITASGGTLLGADDKAGVAEIMAAVAALRHFKDLPHGEVRVCFTSDEEVGAGTVGIDLSRLPKYCYTMDGGFPGELEAECFDAWKVELRFRGIGVHPGYAKGKLVNAATSAARFLAELPESETPERTAGREGFYYVYDLSAGCDQAKVGLIVRDFEAPANQARIARLQDLARTFEARYPGLAVQVEAREQYRNMREIIKDHPRVVELAYAAPDYADEYTTVFDAPVRFGAALWLPTVLR